MSGISKRVSGSWVSGDYGIMKTATDTLTTLPSVLYADGNNATVDLKGNMVQTGTPTPQNPIQPQETGDLETTGEHAGQYKIPISSANTTTPVYMGEVETMRKIKKLVLTGAEGWNINTSGSLPFFHLTLSDTTIVGINVTCTHFTNANIGQSTTEIGIGFAGNAQLRARPDDPASYTLDSWKGWLAQQYAAGTPVTIYYVLETPETAVVNEPIRKIGDYADTVSGISIPTITGADNFDVETSLKPSEVELAYTGWHDATVKEWDGSQWG